MTHNFCSSCRVKKGPTPLHHQSFQERDPQDYNAWIPFHRSESPFVSYHCQYGVLAILVSRTIVSLFWNVNEVVTSHASTSVVRRPTQGIPPDQANGIALFPKQSKRIWRWSHRRSVVVPSRNVNRSTTHRSLYHSIASENYLSVTDINHDLS